MGYIEEPEGVDFVVNSKGQTEADRKRVSDFIKRYKALMKRKDEKRRSASRLKRLTAQ